AAPPTVSMLCRFSHHVSLGHDRARHMLNVRSSCYMQSVRNLAAPPTVSMLCRFSHHVSLGHDRARHMLNVRFCRCVLIVFKRV
ncbi:hypothetical protein, partial [Atlantibacter sp.]|uniref:hypothetical protein n=1 Tax=Atlantibacter sp. TaxID=1903473 RepID=UPI0028979FA0